MSLKQGVAITAIGTFVPPAVMLITQVLLAQSLGVGGRGVVAAATAPLMLLAVFLALGLPEAITFLVARGGVGRMSRKLGLSVIALVIAGVGGIWLIGLSADSLSAGNSELAGLMRYASIALVPALLTGALRGVAFGAHRWWLVTSERILSAGFQLGVVFALFANDSLTHSAATFTLAAGTSVGAIVYLISPRWWAALRPSPSLVTTGPAIGIASYAWRCWVGSMAGILLVRLDQVMMTPLANVEELGLYVVAANVSMVALLFNSAVTQVMFATETSDPNPTRVGRAARATTIMTAVVGACLIAVSPIMIPVLFGREFAGSVPVATILIFEICLAIPGSVAGTALNARGRPGLRSLSLAIGAVVYIFAMVLLVPRYGAIGAALAMAAGTILPGYLAIYWLQRFCGVKASEFYRFSLSDLDVLRPKKLLRFGKGFHD